MNTLDTVSTHEFVRLSYMRAAFQVKDCGLHVHEACFPLVLAWQTKLQ